MIKMKRIAAAAALSTAMVTPAVMAEFTANVGVFSDYVFRGESLSGGDPVVQGGIDYEHESGLYIGSWFSSLPGGGQASYETNLYAGFAFDLSEDASLDVGVLYYYFRNDTSANHVEPYIGLSAGPFSLTFAYGIDYLGGEEDGYFVTAGYELPLSDTLGLGFFVNYNAGDGVEDAYGDTYFDYGVTLTKALPNDFEFSLSLIGNNIDESYDPGIRKESVVLGLSKSFGL